MDTVNIAIVGSRSFDDMALFKKELDKFLKEEGIENFRIISGGALGADKLAKQYAIENNIEIMEIIPEWDKYGKRAGYLRNRKIWEIADLGIAFWDGKSRGTQHSFKLAKEFNKKIKIIKF